MAAIGTIVGGKYEILKEIGRGGMSIVYLAMDKNLNKQWAVKEIRHDVYGAEREMIVQSFLTEANLMKKLDHPTLPRIVDIIDQNYVVMDYIEGESLEKVLQNEGAQDQSKVIEWGKALCEVLDYLHTRVPPVIYRDMKPSNIKLRPDGTIRLLDFGIAREYKKENLDDTTYLGTKGYAAPEQFGGKGQTDARTDVYGLGMTLYHLVTGKNPTEPPYEIYPIRYWNAALSSGLEWIIQKSTQLNPADRFQSCAEMLYALENVEKYSGQYKLKQKQKIHLFAGFLIASAVFLGVGIGSTFAHQGMQNQNYEANLEEQTPEAYKRAIELEPGRPEAYNEWLDLYMTSQSLDGGQAERQIYTAEAAKELESVFDKQNLRELRNDDPEGYAEVCYNTGYLNWYFYEVSDDGEEETANAQITRIVRSLKWFQMVRELNEEEQENPYLDERTRDCIECYYNIGNFFATRESAELGDTGGEQIYRQYFDNVMSLIQTLELDQPMEAGDDTDVNTVIRSQMYNLIIYSLDSNIELFKNQGVTRQEAQELYDIAAENVRALEPEKESTVELRDQIISRLDSVQTKIDMAYEEASDE